MFPSSFLKKIGLGILASVILCSLAYGVYTHFSVSPSQSLNTAAFTDRTGKIYNFNSFKGKPLVVNIWASWCGPCVAEMPSLDILAIKMRAKGGEVLAIIVEPLIGKAVAAFARGNIQYLVPYHDFRGNVAAAFRVSGLPLTILMNEEGQEVFRVPGPLNWDGEEARGLIRHYLKVDL